MQPLPSLEAFLEEVGCPYQAESFESVVWVAGYTSGVARARQIVDREVEVEFCGDNVIRFCKPDGRIG
jgi:adenosylcobinamide amidohydrolase